MEANDACLYTSDNGGNDLKVDSNTSLPVHIDENELIIDVNISVGIGCV
jgi:hypothetical protein